MLLTPATFRRLAILVAFLSAGSSILLLFQHKDYLLFETERYRQSLWRPQRHGAPLGHGHSVAIVGQTWNFQPKRDGRNYGLSEEQCLAAFPKLYREVDRAVQYRRTKAGNLTEQDLDVGWRGDGIVRAMVYDNQLYVIDGHNVGDVNHRPRSLATLFAIHRAVTAYPGRLPNVEFTVTDHDSALFTRDGNHTTWAYSRLREQESLWLMPDFGFWGWPNVGMRSYAELQALIEENENDFLEKIPKAVWRGSLAVGSAASRNGLVKHSKDRAWSAVKELDWKNDTNIAENLMAMEDHCDYMFVIGTEGNSYSGRLKYLLNCHSILLSHPLQWVEHYHHLLESSGPEQNYIELKVDFSDLPKKMEKLLRSARDLENTRYIADNAVRILRHRYLTPAAEACYWRALMRGWASVQGFEVKRWKEVEVNGSIRKKLRGVPLESYAIFEQVEWEIPAKPRILVVGD